MKIEQIEIYSDTSNLAVMRHPGRNFPGSLIQGDSLFILVQEARELHEALKLSSNGDLAALAEMHKEKLEDRLAVYENALLEHGISLPYTRDA